MADEATAFITLLTDFGTDDPWVGSLKGALLNINPQARIVDMTHAVPAHDVFAGGFALYRAYRDFPPWTIHLCVVDPGVGGPRRPILVVTQDRYFIGPDNGLFSFVYAFDEVSRVVHITAEHFFRRPLSATFHARDVFAPVAAWLSKGLDSSRLGEPVEDYVKLAVPMDRIVGESLIKGEICAVDHFGNLITNIRSSTLDSLAAKTGRQRFKVLLGGEELPVVLGGYGQDFPLFALVGSSNLVEIAASGRSAAQLLGITGRGKEIGVMGA